MKLPWIACFSGEIILVLLTPTYWMDLPRCRKHNDIREASYDGRMLDCQCDYLWCTCNNIIATNFFIFSGIHQLKIQVCIFSVLYHVFMHTRFRLFRILAQRESPSNFLSLSLSLSLYLPLFLVPYWRSLLSFKSER